MRRAAFGVPLAILMATGMWLYVQLIQIPHQKDQSLERQIPRGNLSDLYPRWLGARELLLRGRDPYGSDITREVQVGYYGRALDATRPDDPKDQQAFAYPVYVVVMLAPTVRMDFATVHRIFFWLLGCLTLVSVPLWLRALGYRISQWGEIVWILLTLGAFPAIQGLKLQQLSVLVAALIAATFWAITRRHFVVAGVLLALATIKPQLVFLLILWVCIWVVGNWKDRQHLVWSFAATSALLVVTGEVLLPGWIHEFRAGMTDYYRYTGGGNSVLDILLKPTWGRLASGIVIALLLLLVGRLRRADEQTDEFRWSVSLTLATTVLVIPMFAPYNQLLLLPGMMMIVRSCGILWQKSRLSRFFVAITALAVFWPFAVAFGLVIALLFLPGVTVRKAWELPVYPTFAIPILIYAMLLADHKTLAKEPRQQA